MTDESTRQNLAAPALPSRQEEAARLVAEDDLTNEQIAAKVGVKRQTLDLWKKRPDFIGRVNEHKEAFKNRALTEGFADKRARLQLLNSLTFDLAKDMAEPATEDAPKGTYRKEVKIAANGEVVDYVVLDKAKYDTVRGLMDDIAKEMGDRQTKVEVSGDPDKPLVLGLVGVDLERV